MWLRIHRAEDARLFAFRSVLLAAARNGSCRERLTAARLSSPEQIRTLRSIEEALERLTPAPSVRQPLPRPPRRILSGTFEDLLGRGDLPRNASRASVWRSPGEKPLSDAERDRLWERFELPVFEEIRSPQGELLAGECESHDSLHIRESVTIAECLEGELVLTSLADCRWPVLRVRTGRRGELARLGCGCGEAGLYFRAGGGGLTLDASCDIVADVSR